MIAVVDFAAEPGAPDEDRQARLDRFRQSRRERLAQASKPPTPEPGPENPVPAPGEELRPVATPVTEQSSRVPATDAPRRDRGGRRTEIKVRGEAAERVEMMNMLAGDHDVVDELAHRTAQSRARQTDRQR